MKKLKKILAVCLVMVLMGSLFTACGNDDGEGTDAGDKDIHVTSREEAHSSNFSELSRKTKTEKRWTTQLIPQRLQTVHRL